MATTANPSIVIFSQDNFNTKYNRFRKMRSNKGDIIPLAFDILLNLTQSEDEAKKLFE